MHKKNQGPRVMVFGAYADYYDLFYKNKSYAQECDFVRQMFKQYAQRPVRDVLDLGCGSASHAIALAKCGLKVSGIDASARMLALARAKSAHASTPVTFVRAKLQNFNLSKKFDAAICMFSVIDYLTRDADLKRVLSNVHRHLRPGGIFICDFWHATAIAAFTPRKKKIFFQGDIAVERASRTRLFKAKRVCEVEYTCTVRKNNKVIDKLNETHLMRYFDVEEMKSLLADSGLVPVAAGPFLNMAKPIRTNTWDVAIVARRDS